MPQEPRSFFERLTGARVLHPGKHDTARHPAADELTPAEDFYDNDFSQDEVEGALDEPEIEFDDSYSDEDSPDAFSEEEQEGQLTVDVFQDDENVLIQSTIAGVSPEDLDVSITNDMVTIRGERRQQYMVDPEDYFYQECYWGTFSRSIILPIEIDADRAEAKIKNGILTIRIPKANTAVTRKLKVKAT